MRRRLSTLATALLMVGCSGSHEPTDAKTLAQCYQSEFGSAPPSTVSSLQAKAVIIGDAGTQWLRFTADSTTISSIVSGGFSAASRVQFMSETTNTNSPVWWKPSSDHVTKFYSHPKWFKHLSRSEGSAYLAYNETTKVVYFMSSAGE